MGKWFFAVVLAVVCSAVLLPRLDAWPRVHADPLGYFVYLPAAWDGKPFDLMPYVKPYRELPTYPDPDTGRFANIWGIGPALSWLPCYAAARLLHPEATAFTANVVWWWCGYGAVGIVLLGVLLLYLALRRLASDWLAALVAFAALVCSPVVAYASRQPFFAHGLCFSLTCALLWLVLVRPRGVWWLSGLVVGLLFASRPQLALLAALPLVALAGPGWWRRALPFFAGCAVFGGLQMLYWRMTFGDWLVIPQATDAYYRPFFESFALWQVLLHPKHGLFWWHPLLLVGVVGLALLLRRPHPLRWLAVTALLVFASQVVVNALPWDWWAGWSFGARRFCEVVPLLAVGLAFALSRLPRPLAVSLVAVTAWWSLALLDSWIATGPVHPAEALSGLAMFGALQVGLPLLPWVAAAALLYSRSLGILKRSMAA